MIIKIYNLCPPFGVYKEEAKEKLAMEEQVKHTIENKTVLVTGGTGSFGNAAVKRLLTLHPKKIVIFSRDEKKQFDMGNTYAGDTIRYVIGDVRDRDSLRRATQDVDFIFHAAALKHVPNCEFFPVEAAKTNILGAQNVIDSAIENGVERVVVLSTDKAVYPINVMGMTKALMERIMIAASREKRGKTVLCGTRYGNVMYTRGSVIPHFIDLMKIGRPLRITDKTMTRFLMPLHDSIDLVLWALTNGQNGDIYVKKAPAATVGILAEALISLFHYDKGAEVIGARPGEKKHESLISREELPRTAALGDYYRISAEVPEMDYRTYFFKGGHSDHSLPAEGYTSANTTQLSVEEVKRLLLSLDETREALNMLKKQ